MVWVDLRLSAWPRYCHPPEPSPSGLLRSDPQENELAMLLVSIGLFWFRDRRGARVCNQKTSLILLIGSNRNVGNVR